MPFFLRKPVSVEAELYDGTPQAFERVTSLCEGTGKYNVHQLPWGQLIIKTPDDFLIVHVSDWVVKYFTGDVYPCKPEVFREMYQSPHTVVSGCQFQLNGMRFNADGSIADDAIIPNRDWEFGSIRHDANTNTWTVLANNTNPVDSCGNREK